MKKICVLGPALETPSGVSTHVRQLLNSELSKYYTLSHFQVGSQGRRESKFIRLLRLFSDPVRLIWFCHDNDVDVLHINASMDTKSIIRDTIFAYCALLFSLPVVFQVHGGDLPADFCGRNTILEKILKHLFNCVRLVVLGESIRQAYLNFFGELDIHSIPNAIDVGKYANGSGGIDTNKKINLFYIGRIDKTKGVKESIEALSMIEDSFPGKEVQFRIAGGGPYVSSIADLVENKGLDNVNLLGSVFGEDKISLWKEASVFVFPTYHKEAMPYSIIEALASGTPMITTTVGAISEMIEEGEHCLFVEPRDPHAVAAAMKALLEDERRLQEMSLKCRKRAEEMFGLDMLSKRFGDVYHFDS